MLIKDLPAPIRKLAEKRFIEFVTPYKNISNDVNSAYIDSFSWSKTEKYGEGPSFWISIHNGNFTPYYAMYRLPEKWCIKCLPEWLDRKGKVINNDWYRCVKSIKDQLFGDDCSEYYHSNSIIDSVKKEGYTEITLSDWIAANPKNKEQTYFPELDPDQVIVQSNGEEWKILDDEPQFDPINKPKHYNSHPSGIECIEITQYHDFCTGNAIKYLWRQGLKDGENSVTDLKKAVWYIERKINQLENSK